MFAALEVMIVRLAHLFLSGANNDKQIARQAAHGALLAYHPRSEAELMLAAEIISFSFHALDALNRAADPALSINQLCRLRSNAVSLSREAHKAQRKLDQLKRAAPVAAGPVAPEAALPSETVQQEAPPDQADRMLATTRASRPPGQTWTQAYHQRQRDKRLAERARKSALQAAIAKPPEMVAQARSE
jgi:hypothetical protein